MATYIIEVQMDDVDEPDLVIAKMAGALTNIIFNNGLKDNIKVECAYQLDEEGSTILSIGDVLYP